MSEPRIDPSERCPHGHEWDGDALYCCQLCDEEHENSEDYDARDDE